MKLSKFFLGLSGFALALMSPASAFAATLSLSPSTGTLNKGCIVPIAINLNTQGADTDGTDAILIYDTSRFSLTNQSIVNGTIYPDFPGNVVDPSSGKVSISGLASVSSPFKGSGVLATINFQVLSTAPAGATTIKFDFDPNDKAKTTDANVVERGTVQDLLNSVTDGNYVIGTGSCGSTGASPVPVGATGLGGIGSTGIATPSATPILQVLSPGGTSPGFNDATIALVVVGGILTIVGIIGLALF